MQFLQRRLPTVVIACILVTIGLLAVKRGSTQSTQQNTEQKSVVEAIRNGGLREAAKIKGHYVGTIETTGWMKYDLESLVSHSSTVVAGVPSQGSSILANPETIQTEYKVKVSRVFKGAAKPGDILNINVPGGKVVFEDGTSAELTPVDLGPIVENQSYIFFLQSGQLSSNILQLTGGGQGLFELSDNVTPRGHKTDVVQKHKGQKVSDFENAIKAAVRKNPNTLSCCQ